ncbi:MAG: class I SAM-dependent methyltransferase [Deltaproteobacteria bacterium]|nr:class I SAM-dependent methyltransferase [Deltaproteobacteria bacterium]
MAGSAAHVHGLDLSSEMIRIANGKAQAQKVDNVTFHAAPFDDTFRAFEAENLDGICAYSLLHLVDDRSAALEQIFRLLKPGGFFISSTVCLQAAQAWRVLHFVHGLPRRVVGSLRAAHLGHAVGRQSPDGEELRKAHPRGRDTAKRVRRHLRAGRGRQARDCVHRREEAALGKPCCSDPPEKQAQPRPEQAARPVVLA